MRFACQSCGKAYNLPEERIADKSNVKLKCRVCGAIVEVKKQGELVAAPLDEVDDKHYARVSEAPAPLNSLTPEDDEADGATVSIAEGSLNERGPLQFEMPSLPLVAPTGFSGGGLTLGMPPAVLPPAVLPPAVLPPAVLPPAALPPSPVPPAALASVGLTSSGGGAMPPPLSDAGFGLQEGPNVSLPMGPPPLSPSSLPPPPVHAMELPILDEHRAGAANGAANGRGEFFVPDARAADRKGSELLAPVAASASVAPNSGPTSAGAAVMSAGSSAMMGGAGGMASVGPGLSDLSEPVAGEARDPMFKFKMLAAFATGVMVDRIISGLFQ